MRWVAWSQLHRLVKREKKKRKQLEALGVEYEVTPTRPRFFSFFPLPLLFLPPPISSSSYFFLVLLVLLVLVLVLLVLLLLLLLLLLFFFFFFFYYFLLEYEVPSTQRAPTLQSTAQCTDRKHYHQRDRSAHSPSSSSCATKEMTRS